MTRRLATALLAAALLGAGVIVGPCSANASCAMLRAQQMDCCKRPPAGISTPRCCADGQQVSRHVTPATAERPTHRALHASAMSLVSIGVATAPPDVVRALRIDAAAAPPRGTLIAQHTSLLL